MRRITTWLAVTLAVVGFAVYYQVALAGSGQEERPAVAGDCGGQQAERAASTPAPEGGADPCAASDHVGKPGENKD